MTVDSQGAPAGAAGAPVNEFTQFTRRQFMVRWLIMQGSSWQDAVTAVSYAAQRHLDWDMNEQRTFADWKSAVTEGRKRGTSGENSVLAMQGDGSATG